MSENRGQRKPGGKPGGRGLPGTFMLALIVLTALPASAQYPGSPARRADAGPSEPKLRSTAVLEWIGDPGKPGKSRIVPIAVYDGQRYQDGGLYLAKPEPLAVMGG